MTMTMTMKGTMRRKRMSSGRGRGRGGRGGKEGRSGLNADFFSTRHDGLGAIHSQEGRMHAWMDGSTLFRYCRFDIGKGGWSTMKQSWL